jgi:chemotaxis protein methyltransferase CheR
MNKITDTEFSLLRTFLHKVSGIDVPESKKYLFLTRLGDFLQEHKCSSFTDLHTRLTTARDDQLQRKFIASMTIHESSFFRDTYPFDILTKQLLPALAENRTQSSTLLPPRIRILSAGCSLGQEPYSIAMCVKNWLKSNKTFSPENITVLAADISEKILAKARTGFYTDMECGSKVPAEYRCFLTKAPNGWNVTDEIKTMVRFTPLNLAESFTHIGKFDIIFCRNVIIYFPIDLKRKILQQFRQLVPPDGALFLGSSESVYMLSDDFQTVETAHGRYFAPIIKKT